MLESEKKPCGLLHDSHELRKLIQQNPGLPLLIFAGYDCNHGDYSYMSCSYVSASVGEVLDCQQTIDDERVFTDRDDFREAVENELDDFKGTDEEFDAAVNKTCGEYDPYWKPCIIVYVDN